MQKALNTTGIFALAIFATITLAAALKSCSPKRIGMLPIAENVIQYERCGTEAYCEKQMQDPDYKKQFERREKYLDGLKGRIAKRGENLVVPVAIHFQGVSDTVSRACLERLAVDHVSTLNDDFQRKNSDLTLFTIRRGNYDNVHAGAVDFTFQIADQNHPKEFDLQDGDLAITINKVVGDREFRFAGYLNIFVFELSNNILGYSPLGGRTNGDGVAIAPFAFGGGTGCGKFGGRASFEEGRTLTHELGHYFSLNHIWNRQDSCKTDDGIADTPESDSPNFGCPRGAVIKCGSQDLFMNYMDYVNDNCMVMFTEGQSDRMSNWLTSFGQRLTNNAEVVISKPIEEPTEETPEEEIEEEETEEVNDGKNWWTAFWDWVLGR